MPKLPKSDDTAPVGLDSPRFFLPKNNPVHEPEQVAFASEQIEQDAFLNYRFPRSLSDAFPSERAYAAFHHPRSKFPRIGLVWVLLFLLIVSFFASVS